MQHNSIMLYIKNNVDFRIWRILIAFTHHFGNTVVIFKCIYLFYPDLFYPIRLYLYKPFLSYPIPSHPILSNTFHSHPVSPHPIPSYLKSSLPFPSHPTYHPILYHCTYNYGCFCIALSHINITFIITHISTYISHA